MTQMHRSRSSDIQSVTPTGPDHTCHELPSRVDPDCLPGSAPEAAPHLYLLLYDHLLPGQRPVCVYVGAGGVRWKAGGQVGAHLEATDPHAIAWCWGICSLLAELIILPFGATVRKWDLQCEEGMEEAYFMLSSAEV